MIITAEKKKANRTEKLKIDVFCYALLILPIINWIVFWLMVNVDALILPFQDKETGAFTWGYFKVIIEGFKSGGTLAIAFKNTLVYFFTGLITGYLLSLFCSYFLYKKIVAYRFFTIILMIPAIVSSVVLISIYKNFINSTNGPLANIILKLFNYKLPPLLYQETTATATIVFYTMFMGLGGNLIIFSGSLSKIPPEIVEAAQIEGVGFFREMFTIELPLILHTILVLLLFSVMNVLGSTGPILVFTQGKYATQTISYWFYENVIASSNYNLASAFGLCLTLVSVPLVIVCQWLRNRIEPVQF